MIRKIQEQTLAFNNDISAIESQNSNVDIKNVLLIIKDKIIDDTKKCYETDNFELRETLKANLIRYYNLLYFYQAKLKGAENAFTLDEEIEQLPNMYLVDQLPEKFEIDGELIRDIDLTNGLTNEQAIELLKWTVNNTRENLNLEEQRRLGKPGDVYGNSCLGGACGLSQFSTLYPLRQLGLEVTINNIGEVNGGRHAYGTVVIPINNGDQTIKKRFLLDCSYRQFFTIPLNVVSRYFICPPFAGFYVCQDEELIEFSKELLKNGFVEANLENMQKYLKPFFARSLLIEDFNKLDEKFSQIDINEILLQRQTEFDYTEEDFEKWGLNTKFTLGGKKI